MSQMELQNVCPECRAGKHANCTGEAWDEEADELTTCDCAAVGHD
jgi:hypothetical protein